MQDVHTYFISKVSVSTGEWGENVGLYNIMQDVHTPVPGMTAECNIMQHVNKLTSRAGHLPKNSLIAGK